MHLLLACCLVLLFCRPAAYAADMAVTPDRQLLLQLQETVRQQQEQLHQQAEQLRQQAERLHLLERHLSGTVRATSPALLPTAAVPAPPEATPGRPPLVAIRSANDSISLTLSGQINRAMNVAGDGGGTRVYHVDNNVSNSRLRLVGTSPLTDDLSLGTRLEVSFTADESSQVSQTNQTPGTYLDVRWADISLASKRYGKISLGKGNTASYFTAASDLSKTDIVLYSSVADIAGGLLFRDRRGQLTDTSVASVFNDFDGLNVKSRLRYDSPVFRGFRLAGSVVSKQRLDLGLYWEGEGGGFQSAASFGLSNPRSAESGLQYDGSFSVLHRDSGLNFTLSSGMLEKKSRNDAVSVYLKLGWLTQPTSLGYTAFGIDHARSEHVRSAGDRATSVGAAVVQEIRKIAAEIYLQYRLYALKTGNAIPVHDIIVGTLGVRIKF